MKCIRLPTVVAGKSNEAKGKMTLGDVETNEEKKWSELIQLQQQKYMMTM